MKVDLEEACSLAADLAELHEDLVAISIHRHLTIVSIRIIAILSHKAVFSVSVATSSFAAQMTEEEQPLLPLDQDPKGRVYYETHVQFLSKHLTKRLHCKDGKAHRTH